jgi:hypothetical protein
MARCPFCNEILSDAWVKKTGAALMGKEGGINKARSRTVASNAGKQRWKKAKKKAPEFPT